MDLAQKLNQENFKSLAFKDIKKYLIANFLFKGDLDSINILLNLYNVYESIENIYPRYVTLENLRKDIIKIYRQKEGIEVIARNLSSLIHDDSNRLELYLYLEGYRLGFNSKKHINLLEIITLKYLTIDELYNRNKLFQYEFKNEEVFVPEVLVAARAMNKGIEILKPYLQDTEHQSKGTVILGTVKGDLHDIGKNLVKIMLEGKGLEVVDLGVDVDAQKFVEEAKIHQAQIICCSALLTTTMPEMKKVVDLVAQEHLNVKVMIGGAPVNQDYCNEIGADYYTDDATSASEVAYAIVGGTLC